MTAPVSSVKIVSISAMACTKAGVASTGAPGPITIRVATMFSATMPGPVGFSPLANWIAASSMKG